MVYYYFNKKVSQIEFKHCSRAFVNKNNKVYNMNNHLMNEYEYQNLDLLQQLFIQENEELWESFLLKNFKQWQKQNKINTE